ncbi:DsbA family protein [Blastococcus litoris]|uniref:DsbA family protein n=1 Tax=Blastococcus litoris TaxID=2171622 RepID=UPI000E3040F0|nr:thioredoxin domain-containing protein [Blastococcus litoris]
MPASGSRSTGGTARQRRDARRAAEEAARAADRRRRRRVLGGVAAAVALVVALVVVIAVQSRRTDTPDTVAAPSGAVDDGTAFRVGPADAAVTVDLYEDFQCPTCRAFEDLSGDTLASLAADGTIALRYRPVAILDRASTDRYSTRALNAAAVVADTAGVEAFVEFHGLLFDRQPAEGGPGLTDDELIELAGQAGATGPEVERGIRDLVFEDWTTSVTDAASRAGLQGTPTIMVDGTPLDLRQATPEGITAAVQAAGG